MNRRLFHTIVFSFFYLLAAGQNQTAQTLHVTLDVPPYESWDNDPRILNDNGCYVLQEKIELPTSGKVSVTWHESEYGTAPEASTCSQSINHRLIQVRDDFTLQIEVPLIISKNGQSQRLLDGTLLVSYDASNRIILRNSFKESSVLQTGEWYKIATEKEGMYRVDLSLFEESDISGSDLNPNQVKFYGNGGGLVPERNNAERIDDLEEIPVLWIGNADNTWGQDEYFLFYAESSDDQILSVENKKLDILKNPYSFQNHYFIKINDGNHTNLNTKDLNTVPSQMKDAHLVIQHFESEQYNLLDFRNNHGSGKSWLGDIFSTSTPRNYTDQFDLNNFSEESIAVHARTATMTFSSGARWQILVDDYRETDNASSVSESSNVIGPAVDYTEFSGTTSSSNGRLSTISFSFFPNSAEATGWLDYVQISGKKDIVLDNSSSEQIFYDIDTDQGGITEYSINETGVEVWNVTNGARPIRYSLSQRSGLTVWQDDGNNPKKFITFKIDQINSTPTFVEKVNNQNLHALNRADMIVVYHEQFRNITDRFVDYRKEDGLEVLKVNVADIYNEFGGGTADAGAIRDFFRMIYERDDRFKYALLMGDGTFDMRRIRDEFDFQNFIPTYQTDNSQFALSAYPSDDFYALLDPSEGTSSLSGGLDIAVGRFPIATDTEGQIVLDKIQAYERSPDLMGDWRRKITIIADDEDDNLHLDHTEEISGQILRDYDDVIVDKIVIDAFEQVANSGGARYPDANEAILNNYNQGQLLINYIGHGSSTSLAQERIVTAAEIDKWIQVDGLPIFFTATCSFTSYDDATERSAGEKSLLMPGGGVVCLLSTVRIVFASQNKALAQGMYSEIFKLDNNQRPRIGEVIRRTKNNFGSVNNNRKFGLFGDPSMIVPVPLREVVLDQLNGQDPAEFQDTLGALGTVSLSGHVAFNDVRESDFNGRLTITILDKPVTLRTRGQDEDSQVTEFEVQKTAIFRGSTAVENGEWSLDFVLPADINFEFGEGRILFYAETDDLKDASGAVTDVMIGGTSANAITDDTPPIIDLRLDREDFQSGDETGRRPLMLVDLEDDFGINTTGVGLGHDIVAILDGNIQNKIVLNDEFQGDLDNHRNGSIRYRLPQLEPGPHTLTFRVWDIGNNFSEVTVDFVVINEFEFSITDLIAFPVPTADGVTFGFNHDLPTNALVATIDIYAADGKHLHREQSNVTSNLSGRIERLRWDGALSNGSRPPTGLYYYKISLQANTTADGETFFAESPADRLIIIE